MLILTRPNHQLRPRVVTHLRAEATTDDSRPDLFKREFYAATSVWTAKRRRNREDRGAAGSGETHVWLMQIVHAARIANMRISSESLALYRALLTAETVTSLLGARTDLRRVGGDFFPSLQIRELFKPLTPLEVQSIAGSLVELLKRAPERIEHLLAELSSGRFTLNVETQDSIRDQRLADRRARQIAVAIISVGLALLLVRSTLPIWFGVPLAWPIGVALAACYIWLFLQWRRAP